jgi:hypothetical protein
MALLIETVVDLGMNRAELLQRFRASKSPHCMLSSSQRLVRNLGLRLLRHVSPTQRYRLHLSEDILAPREAQLLPRFLEYARQKPRASAVLAQGHGRQHFVRVKRIRCNDLSRQHVEDRTATGRIARQVDVGRENTDTNLIAHGASQPRRARSGRARPSADDGSDMRTAQRGGQPAWHESIHELHALDVARRRHDLQ